MPAHTKRILWICRDRLLRQVEVPFLRETGFEIYIPASLLGEDEVPPQNTIPEKDRELLDRFDFFGHYFSPDIIEAVNRNFPIAMGELNQYLADSLVSFFSGVTLLREMAYGAPLGDPRKIEEIFPPASSFWASFYEKRSRIFLLSMIQNIPPYLDEVFRNHSIWLPPLFPFHFETASEPSEPRRNAVLFSCPEVLSCKDANDRFQSLRKLCKGIPFCVLGHQSVKHGEDCAEVWGETEEAQEVLYRECAVYFDPSQNAAVIDRATIKALMHNMPVLFMRGGYLAGLESAKELPGCCSSPGEALEKIERIVSGDESLRRYILDTQEVLKKNFHLDFQKYYYYNLLFPCLEKALEIPVRPKRIGIVMQHPYIGGGTLKAFKQIIQMFLRLKVNLSVGLSSEYLDKTKPFHKLDIVEEIRKEVPLSVPIKTFQYQPFQPEFQINCNFFCQTVMRTQPDFLLNDAINFFQECDEFIFISDRTESNIRMTEKPYSLIVYDYLQRYVDHNFIPENYEERMMHFVRNAKQVFVTTEATGKDVASYVGYPEDKVIRLPFELSFREIENYLAEPEEKHRDGYAFKRAGKTFRTKDEKAGEISRNYILWACNSSEHKNHVRVIQAFQKFCQENINDKELLVVTGVLTDHLDPSNDDFLEYPHVKEFKQFLKQNPDIRKRVFFAGEMPRHAFLTTMKNADAVLLSSVYDNGAYAAMESASFRVPCISARYPGIQELADYLKVEPSWYDPYDVDSIADAMILTLKNREDLIGKLPGFPEMKRLDFENMTEKFGAAMHGVIDG